MALLVVLGGGVAHWLAFDDVSRRVVVWHSHVKQWWNCRNLLSLNTNTLNSIIRAAICAVSRWPRWRREAKKHWHFFQGVPLHMALLVTTPWSLLFPKMRCAFWWLIGTYLSLYMPARMNCFIAVFFQIHSVSRQIIFPFTSVQVGVKQWSLSTFFAAAVQVVLKVMNRVVCCKHLHHFSLPVKETIFHLISFQ